MAAEDEIKKTNDALKRTAEELSFISDAFVSIAATIEDLFDKANEGADKLTEKVNKTYKRDIVNSINQMSKGLDRQVGLQEKLNKIQQKKDLIEFSVSKKQERKGLSLLEDYRNSTLVGKTNKGNLVLNINGKQVKVTPEGKTL